MLWELLTMGLRGMVRELEINPRDIRIDMLLDSEQATLARIDAKAVRDLLRRAAHRRTLRVSVGKLAYDIDLGRREESPSRSASSVRQRGDRKGM